MSSPYVSQNLCEALTAAVHSKDAGILEQLVQQGADVNMALSEGLLPLVLAANNCDLSTCDVLMRLGARLDGNAGVACRDSPLSIAVRAGLCNAVDTLIELGSNVNVSVDFCQERRTADPFRLYPGSTVLHLAVFRHNLAIVKRLVNAGADVNRADCSGNTSLHLACLDPSGETDVVHFLLSLNRGTRAACRRADVDARNCLDQTPLMLAASRNAELTRLLLKEKPMPILEAQDKGQRTVLHYAAETGVEETVMMLLRAGCKVDGTRMLSGRVITPLHVAMRAGNSAISQILLDFGADPMVLTITNDTVLHLAACCPYGKEPLELLRYFLNNGINLEARNSAGYTPLVVAANCGNPVIVQYLINAGARLNEPGNNGMTALTLSISGHHRDVAIMLLVEGANPNAGSLRQPKRIHWAKFREQMPVFKLLILSNETFARRHLEDYLRAYGVNNDANAVSQTACDPLQDEMLAMMTTPRQLLDLCRLSVRSALAWQRRGAGIVRSIARLPLPRSLRSYLCYVDEITQLSCTGEAGNNSDASDDERLTSSVREL